MRVIVAMSGGVDSSVAALLLKKAGYEVIGLFMRNWDSTLNNDLLGNPNLDQTICPQEQDYNDAKEICQKLDIPLKRVDFVKEYWDDVFSYFLNEIKNNRTPNPDVMCNKYIKFSAFRKEALKLGADYIATGHYARLEDNHLLKAVDLKKDQTYFLALVAKENLQNILFPIGHLKKEEVRQIAQENNLITALKKDSTGICFIGERHYRKFLQNYFENKPGDIIDIDSDKKVGEHQGLIYYTIGQRRGLNVGGQAKRSFVVGKNIKENQLLICFGEDNPHLLSDEAIIENINYLAEIPNNCMAKFRYMQKDNKIAIVERKNDYLRIKYHDVKAVTPGQTCVFYDNNICLGGGIITKVYYKGKRKVYL